MDRSGAHQVRDILFVGLMVAFFTLMVGYVAGCARLGRANEQEQPEGEEAR